MKKVLLATTLLACVLTVAAYANPINTTAPDSVQWMDAAQMPAGAKVAILMGDPSKKEPFIARVKLPAGYTMPVHSHPINEYDTVLSGTWYLGTGDHMDQNQALALPAGSFAKIAAHTSHYGFTKDETIIQINGVGPWGMIYPKKAG